MEKFCRQCKKEKKLIEFSKDRYNNDGLNHSCRICQKNYFIFNKETILFKLKNYRESNPVRVVLNKSKYRAKKLNKLFDLTEEYFNFLPIICPILEIPLTYHSSKKANPNSFSLDRIDNSKGYIKGNVRIISYRANALKLNSAKEEIQKIINYVKNPFQNFKEISDDFKNDYIKLIKKKFINKRKDSKRKNIFFNITLQDFQNLFEFNCPVFGFPLNWNGKNHLDYNFPSLDRIDSNKGYEMGNIRIISNKANVIKSNATLEELQLIHDRAFEPIIPI